MEINVGDAVISLKGRDKAQASAVVEVFGGRVKTLSAGKNGIRIKLKNPIHLKSAEVDTETAKEIACVVQKYLDKQPIGKDKLKKLLSRIEGEGNKR